jgi:hypothetical protein
MNKATLAGLSLCLSAAALTNAPFQGATATAQQPPLQADHYLHGLMVIDTHADGVGEHTKASRDNIDASILTPIRQLGRNGFLGDVKTLDGNFATKARIVEYFRNLPQYVKFDSYGRRLGGWDNGDTVLFYYNGHGGVVDGRHVLTMKHGDVARSLIESEIRKLNPRLALILTDCCSTFSEQAAGSYGGAAAANLRAMRKLFLRGRGVVNVTAAERGRSAWIFPSPIGGAFTRALAQGLTVAGPGVTWDSLMDDVDRTSRDLTANTGEPQKTWRMRIQVTY